MQEELHQKLVLDWTEYCQYLGTLTAAPAEEVAQFTKINNTIKEVIEKEKPVQQ